ncbi:GroES-like zinc-binding dehydrogenase family protein [Striga asiatica]|uniref:GroES-like zinc-binding dehydrogenase family protein n=1 Tax=Striga asiatica TaxID=4170 RepID=A0A5A7QG62_STRAF|nr:GroES-like zinc-binding dehydrogenase family protein [Striga asiatica]
MVIIKETLSKTKKLFHKTFKNLKKSLIFVKYQEQPTNPSPNPTLQVVDSTLCRSYSEKWDSIEVKAKIKNKEVRINSANAQTKKNEHITTTRSISFASCRGLECSKEEKNVRKNSAKKTKESSFRGVDLLARKMKDLEMMNMSDMDHVLDVEEVLHYYSRLNCPTYVEIVDKFFTEMHSDFHAPPPQPSRSGSMRKLRSGSVHGSMRSLAY